MLISVKVKGSDIVSKLGQMNSIKLGEEVLNITEEKQLRQILIKENIDFVKDINAQLPDVDLTPLINSKELHKLIMNIAIYLVDLPPIKSSKIEELSNSSKIGEGIKHKSKTKSNKTKSNKTKSNKTKRKSKNKRTKRSRRSKKGGAMQRYGNNGNNRTIVPEQMQMQRHMQRQINMAVNNALAQRDQEGFMVRLVRNNPLAYFLTKLVYVSNNRLGRVFTYMLILSFISINLYILYTISMDMYGDALAISEQWGRVTNASSALSALKQMDVSQIPVKSILGAIPSILGNYLAGDAGGRMAAEMGVMRAEFNLESMKLQRLIAKKSSHLNMLYFCLVFLALFIYMIVLIPRNQGQRRRAINGPQQGAIEYDANYIDLNAPEVN